MHWQVGTNSKTLPTATTKHPFVVFSTGGRDFTLNASKEVSQTVQTTVGGIARALLYSTFRDIRIGRRGREVLLLTFTLGPSVKVSGAE